MNKFEALFNEYNCNLNDEIVSAATAKILDAHFNENNNVQVYQKCLSFIDLTSLNCTDTEDEIYSMINKVNDFTSNFPHLDNVAAICVYPSLLSIVTKNITENIGIASVAAGFPASQTFVEIKVAETAMAVMEGATEIDIVISVGKFLEENYDEVFEEIEEIKASCKNAHLKVILETGALQSASNIKKASLLAMAAGANFIKTSTGKIPIAATLEAAYTMCHAIKEWNQKTGTKIGFKAAGGIVSTEDAVKYYTLVKEILGEEWLNNDLFRIGASRLTNNLLSSIEQKEIKYF